MTRAELDALIEEATVDCYNDEEQITGLFTMIDEHLAVPFRTEVLGVAVTVAKVDLTVDHEIVAICHRDNRKQAIAILDLPLPDRPPDGAEWIEGLPPLAPLNLVTIRVAVSDRAQRESRASGR